MNFGLFGAGRVGRVHARNISDHGDAVLAAVHDPSKDAARAVTERCGGKMVEAPDDILGNPEIDAVLIASPTNTHVELIRGAVRSGKAVYCEKPIDLDLARANSVRSDVRETGVPVFIGFRRRFLTELGEIRARIRSGAIGAVETVHIAAWDATPPPLAYVEVSGGFLRDKAIHYFDMLCWLTGEAPVSVQVCGSCLVDDGIAQLGDVDTVMATLSMPNGALAHITNGRRYAAGIREQVEVVGSLGSLLWDVSRNAEIIQVTTAGTVLSSDRLSTPYYRQETFAAALDAFIVAVKSGAPVTPSFEDGLRAQAIADAATMALRSRQTVDIAY